METDAGDQAHNVDEADEDMSVKSSKRRRIADSDEGNDNGDEGTDLREEVLDEEVDFQGNGVSNGDSEQHQDMDIETNTISIDAIVASGGPSTDVPAPRTVQASKASIEAAKRVTLQELQTACHPRAQQLVVMAIRVNSKHLQVDDEESQLQDLLLKHAATVKYLSIVGRSFKYLREKMVIHKPHIVHFMGRGDTSDIPLFSEQATVPNKDWCDLFATFSCSVVILNSCFSHFLAKDLHDVGIPVTVGTSDNVSNQDATNFSVGFWDALLNGYNVWKACEIGNLALCHKERDQYRMFCSPLEHVVKPQAETTKIGEMAVHLAPLAPGRAPVLPVAYVNRHLDSPPPVKATDVVEYHKRNPGRSPIATLFHGGSGTGKSTIVFQLFSQSDIEVKRILNAADPQMLEKELMTFVSDLRDSHYGAQLGISPDAEPSKAIPALFRFLDRLSDPWLLVYDGADRLDQLHESQLNYIPPVSGPGVLLVSTQEGNPRHLRKNVYKHATMAPVGLYQEGEYKALLERRVPAAACSNIATILRECQSQAVRLPFALDVLLDICDGWNLTTPEAWEHQVAREISHILEHVGDVTDECCALVCRSLKMAQRDIVSKLGDSVSSHMQATLASLVLTGEVGLNNGALYRCTRTSLPNCSFQDLEHVLYHLVTRNVLIRTDISDKCQFKFTHDLVSAGTLTWLQQQHWPWNYDQVTQSLCEEATDMLHADTPMGSQQRATCSLLCSAALSSWSVCQLPPISGEPSEQSISAIICLLEQSDRASVLIHKRLDWCRRLLDSPGFIPDLQQQRLKLLLAESLIKVGGVAEAFSLAQCVDRRFANQLGGGSPLAGWCMQVLANCNSSIGQHGEAIRLKESTRKLRQEVLGEKHPDTLMSMKSLAASYWSVGRHDEAIELEETTLKLRQEVLGEKHPDTLTSMESLAASYWSVGRHDEAIELDETTLKLRQEVLGESS